MDGLAIFFDVRGSASLSEEQKRMVMGRLATRINKEGILQIVSQRTRSQELNRTDALNRFSELLQRALTPQLPRIQTRIPPAAKRQRLEEKKKRSTTKETRSRKEWDS